MPASVPELFDRALLRRRLARAVRAGHESFLLDRATDELTERLGAVSRSFPRALDLGTPTGTAAAALLRDDRVGQVVRLASHRDGAATLVADEERLPFAAESFGLVVSLLALQGANDLPGILAQVRRSLAPDGLFLAAMLGGDTLAELRTSLAAAESEIEGGVSPRVAPFGDVRALGGLLQRAGFALPVVDVDRIVVRYGSLFGLMRDLRAMGWTNALSLRRRTPLRRATLMRAAALYADSFADPDGRVRATFDIVWLSGWAPHESQQRPLAPGSARTRLADALGVPEHGPEGPR
ncbi:methyltransferase domain-containing protein [Enterovirga sp.]|jgi:SAM-dependent methyltransferase|uniref:methyltransferase domain-containing protein n=1 Tax=Enterovirga sp. TaxID=2026350 RepID=UPI0026118710|nr:methyltransferase domain-containing protein [Enterovirga sp.]MDB5589726.1 SAM-dependent methyltransferase [Enterovirga sp.]